MNLTTEDIKKVMANKTDQELYEVVYSDSEDYTADAVEIANQEFNSRNLDAPTLCNLSTAGEEVRRRQQARLGWPLRIAAFLFSTVFFGIPAILAHRYFVERGARRKAREWGRWGLFGFGFYVALFITIRFLLR